MKLIASVTCAPNARRPRVPTGTPLPTGTGVTAAALA